MKNAFLAFVSFAALVVGFRLSPHPNHSHKSLASETEAKYTDMHVHLACLDVNDSGCFVSKVMMDSYKFSIYLKALGVTLEEMSQTNNQIVVERLAAKVQSSRFIKRVVLLGLDGVIDQNTGEIDRDKSQIVVPNSFILGAVRRYPQIFLYGPSINPYRRDALEQLEQVKRDGAVLVKWIPSTMLIDPADPKIIRFYDKLRQLHLPLLVHTGKEKTFVSAQDDLCDPRRLRVPLDRGVTIIAAHMATSGAEDNKSAADWLIDLFNEPKYKNLLYADISANTQVNRVTGFLKLLQNPVFKDRLIFGTDWPLIEVSLAGMSIAPYHLYGSIAFGHMITDEQVTQLDLVTNSFDREVLLKKFLGVPEDIFLRTDQVLHLK